MTAGRFGESAPNKPVGTASLVRTPSDLRQSILHKWIGSLNPER
jgi:hypothetical protein